MTAQPFLTIARVQLVCTETLNMQLPTRLLVAQRYLMLLGRRTTSSRAWRSMSVRALPHRTADLFSAG